MNFCWLGTILLSSLLLTGCVEPYKAKIIDSSFNLFGLKNVYGSENLAVNKEEDHDLFVSAAVLNDYMAYATCKLIRDESSSKQHTVSYDLKCLNFPEGTVLSYDYFDGVDRVDEVHLSFKDKTSLEPFLKQITEVAGTPYTAEKTYQENGSKSELSIWEPVKKLQLISSDNLLSLKTDYHRNNPNIEPVLEEIKLYDTFLNDYMRYLDNKGCNYSYKTISEYSGFLKVDGKCYADLGLKINGSVELYAEEYDYYKIGKASPRVITSIGFSAGDFSDSFDDKTLIIDRLTSKYGKPVDFQNYFLGYNSDLNNYLWLNGFNNILFFSSKKDGYVYIYKGFPEVMTNNERDSSITSTLDLANFIKFDEKISVGKTKINELYLDSAIAPSHRITDDNRMSVKHTYMFSPIGLYSILSDLSVFGRYTNISVNLGVSLDDTIDFANIYFTSNSPTESAAVRRLLFNRLVQIYDAEPQIVKNSKYFTTDYIFTSDADPRVNSVKAIISVPDDLDENKGFSDETYLYLSSRNTEKILNGLVLGVTKIVDYINTDAVKKCGIRNISNGMAKFNGDCMHINGTVYLYIKDNIISIADIYINCYEIERSEYLFNLRKKYGEPREVDFGTPLYYDVLGRPDYSWYSPGLAIEARYTDSGIKLSYLPRVLKFISINNFKKKLNDKFNHIYGK